MRARLNAERAKSVGGADLEGGRLNARLLGIAGIEHGDAVTVLLGPAYIHAQQHLCEVGGINAAGARTNGDDGRQCVVLTV